MISHLPSDTQEVFAVTTRLLTADKQPRMEDATMRYCPACGERLLRREIAGRERPVCPSCGFIGFRTPRLAAGVLVGRDGGVLLTRRAHQPGLGLWGLPAGFIEWDEHVENAAVREVREETGLEIQLDRLVGVYSNLELGTVLIVYAGSTVGGELQTSDESDAVAFFPLDALPELAFPQNAAIIAQWCASSR
jgi:8-oxo-dGTP diphosphatase